MATFLKERELATEPIVQSDHLTVSRWLAETIARWRVIGLVLLAAIAATILAVLVIPPVYRTQVSFVANVTSGARLPTSTLAAPEDLSRESPHRSALQQALIPPNHRPSTSN